MENNNFKYNEDKHLTEALEYIKNTYDQHYNQNKKGIQVLDVWDSMNVSQAMCRGTAIKYLMRYGKKQGKNRKDLLKAIHYIILLMHYEDKHRMDFLESNNKEYQTIKLPESNADWTGGVFDSRDIVFKKSKQNT